MTSNKDLGKLADEQWWDGFNCRALYWPNYQEMVQEFQTKFKQQADRELYFKLVQEETEELAEAVKNNDRVGIADAICDIIYVSIGLAIGEDLPLDSLFQEVHASNMSKLGEDGDPILRPDGKILKGPNYEPPALKELIEEYDADKERERNANNIPSPQ